MTERMIRFNSLSPFYNHISDRALELELNRAGWYCNRKNKTFKKNDIVFNCVNDAYDYEFNEVSDEV